ncbi:hypothetical protein CQW23_12803 [Capsicum baccatum]|uniref:Uncharacterized protein n=1 Tax=Capsicum baccatum TaxID=33114 RepID=A0A2G2WTM3_CAPBA|nr:hypothetical protein CQW23_12803 [Capsicum baccatum]
MVNLLRQMDDLLQQLNKNGCYQVSNYFEKVPSDVLPEDIVDFPDFIERLKNEEDQTVLDTDQIEKLPFLSACLQLYHYISDDSNAEISRISYEVHDMVQSLFHHCGDDILVKLKDHIVPRLYENINSSIISDHHSESSATLIEDQLVELLDGFIMNLHYLPKLLEASPDILGEYFIHLQQHMVNAITPSTSARHIHIMIEFLLIILTDVPKDFIHYEKLFVLLARVGALIREISVLVRNLEDNTKEINGASLNLLENIGTPEERSQECFLESPFKLISALLPHERWTAIHDYSTQKLK